VQHWHMLLTIQQQRLNERESRLFMHYMVSDVSEVEIDRTSRVLVPRKLREHAGIGEDVVLVGMYDRLEVWGSQVWVSHLNELEEEHETSLSKVLSMPSIKPSFPRVEARP
jgi:MraZ protein